MSRRLVSVIAVLALVVAIAACGADDDGDALPSATVAPPGTDTPRPESPTPSSAPSPSVTAVPSTATPVPPEPGCTADIPLRVRLGQLLMPMVVPADYPALEAVVNAHQVGSVALLGTPTREDLEALARARSGGGALQLLVASDEEGGTVQRLLNVFGPLPTAEALAASLTPAEVEDMFAAYGDQLASVGVGMALAPVVDVGGGPGIGSRSFSSDPAVVQEYAAAVVAGYRRAGIVPVLKHFPGHGGASADTHDALARTAPLDELAGRDLLPFEALAGPGVGVMVGHLVVPGLTDDLPASLSPAAIDGLLRTELGFDGLVITDALNMGAIAQRWGTPEAVVLSLLAGADVAIVDDLGVVPAVLDHLEEAVDDGTLAEERVDQSVARVLAAKGTDPCTVADGL